MKLYVPFYGPAPGSNPKHNIYAFFYLYLMELWCEKFENKQNRAWD